MLEKCIIVSALCFYADNTHYAQSYASMILKGAGQVLDWVWSSAKCWTGCGLVLSHGAFR